MSAYPEPTPFDQPFPGATKILKQELSKNLKAFFYRFEHEKQAMTSMSQLMRLNETLFMKCAKEIGGKSFLHMQRLMDACGDFANGHGKLKELYERAGILRDSLRS